MKLIEKLGVTLFLILLSTIILPCFAAYKIYDFFHETTEAEQKEKWKYGERI